MNELFNPDLSGARAPSGLGSNYILRWSLRPWWRSSLFLAAILAGSVWMSAAALRSALSAYRLDAVSIADVQNALRWDPDNPDLVHRLGLVYTYDQTDLDTSESLKYLRQAVVLNPRRWEFWSDLGTSCDFVMDTACSDEAFRRAWALNPMGPTLGWAMGNHYLLTNRPEKAFPFFRTLLGLSPDYREPTFRLCLRATHDPELIYAEVLPHDTNGSDRFAFLNFLVSTGDYDNAVKIWKEMIAGPDRSPSVSLVRPFLNSLTDNNHLPEATRVWDDLQHAGVIPASMSSPGKNLLYNGNFARPPLDAGFDWRVSNAPEIVLDFSASPGFKDNNCLRIDFSVGRNADYTVVSQIVPVNPKTSYQLSAYVRSENLTSDSGPRLRVVEMGCNGCVPATSDSMQGTTSWHPVEVPFTTQAQTEAVLVSFWRPQTPSALGDITGTAWLDDVNLHAVNTSETGVSTARSR